MIKRSHLYVNRDLPLNMGGLPLESMEITPRFLKDKSRGEPEGSPLHRVSTGVGARIVTLGQSSYAYDSLPQGILNQLQVIVNTQLFHETGLVSLNRFQSDIQHLRYLSGLVSFNNQFQHFSFPIG